MLVIVSGAPGSGKTTLARRLSGDPRLPLLSKDALKEVLADAMRTPPDVPASMRLGDGAYAVLHLTVAAPLEAESGVVMESNSRRGALVVETTDGWRQSHEELREFAALPEAAMHR